MKRIGLISLKIILWITGIVIFLVLLVFFLIRLPSVQNFARKKVVSYLEGKIKTKVEINHISLNLPKLLVLEDVYFEDQQKDTLIAGDTLKVDISLLKLLNNKVEINEIDLRGVTANISRGTDSVFNFDYIVNAFVGEQKKEPAPSDTASTMKFSIDKINLDRIKGHFKDAITANDADVYIGHFDTRVKEFDLDKMKFEIPKMKLSGLNARIIQTKPIVKSESVAKEGADAATPFNMDLKLGTISADKLKVYYRNDVSSMLADASIESFETEAETIDLKNQQIALKNVDLKNSKVLFQLGKTQQAKLVAKEAVQEAEAQAANWKFKVDAIKLAGNDIRFDNFNMPVLKKGMDFGHLDLRKLDLNLNDLNYSIDSISGSLANASFSEKSGFKLEQATTDFVYGTTKTYLNNLYIKTAGSVIRDRILLNYPSIGSLSTNPGALYVNASVNKSRISFRDVLTFMPTMASMPPFKDYPNASLTINGKVTGLVKDLNIPDMDISGFRNTRVRASARIKGLPDMNKAYFDVTIKEFSSRSSDLLAFAPKGSIPSNIRLPEAIAVKGTFKGGMTAFSTNLDLSSSYGSAKVIADYNAKVVGKEKYKANFKLFNFDAGRMLKQDPKLGRITLSGNVAGTGIDPKKLSAVFDANVIKAEYNGYTYRNLVMNGKDINGDVVAAATMKDANLAFKMDATAALSGKYPAIKATLDLDSVNLKALNFVTDDLRLHGKMEADLATADPDYLNGSVILTNAIINRNGERYQLDSVSVRSTATADSSTLNLESEVMSADMSGQYKLTQLGYAFQNLVNTYFAYGAPPVKPVNYTDQRLTFSARLINGPLFQQFVPDLKELSTITFNGRFNSATSELLVNGNAPRILYGTNDVSNVQFNVNTANSALNYSFGIGKIATPQLQLLNTAVSGNAKNNVLFADVQVKDKDKKTHYRIAGDLRSMGKDFAFGLRPDGLVLNYDLWTVSSGNEIHFGEQGIQASNFTLSNASQRLSVNTTPPGMNNPLKVELSNFKIETLTSMVKKDSLLVGGTINGNVLASDLQTTPVFTADMRVDNFNFRGDTLGVITAKVNNQTANRFTTTVSINGNGNQADLDGYYDTGSSSFNMDLDIANINLKSIEGFTFGAMNRATGSINGKLSITGTASAPKVKGALNFNKAAFNITMLNSYFTVRDNQIDFTDDGIRFNDFALIDSAGNTASVAGMIYTKTFTDFRFDLNVNSDNFRGLNSTSKDNELYYGQLYFDTRLRIGGTLTAPAVDGTIRVNDKTKFTIVLPQTDPGIEEREGIVEFVDMDNPDLEKILSSKLDSLNQTNMTGMDVNLNLEVDKNAEFNIIVDAGNGDFLRVRGDAKLNAGIDPSGKITMTGTYELAEGAYELSFNFLRRKFEIKKGSIITWTGEPTTADVNVTATYIANTSPLDLVDNVLGDVPAAQRNTYKQKLPFNVDLTLKGELMKPEITFDIVLPERNYNVSSEMTGLVNDRLTQLRQEPSELNKQVFALLLLNRFVGENPFATSSGGGGGAESIARASVSKLLSEQLNNLAGDLLGGVELNFDLQASEDYTTGQMANRTDLNVGLSKRLLNDRLKVNVGSNFELEGPKQPGARTSNFAGDLSVEYQLSKSGAYLLKAYQKNEYQVAIQGQVIETGVGFVLTMDYNKFQEIFKRITAEDKARKRAERKEKKEAKELEKQEQKTDE